MSSDNKYRIDPDSGETHETFLVDTVSKFVELVTSFRDGAVFRGQRQDLPLLPVIGRPPNSANYWNIERTIMEDFKREAIRFLTYIPQTEWQWLAVARHNGLPTRLLDWSTNPLFALWSAVNESAKVDKSGDALLPGVVWAYSPHEDDVIRHSGSEESPYSILKTQIYVPEHIFPNIYAQSGLFTVHPKSEQGVFVPFEKEKDAEHTLRKIKLPGEYHRHIRYDLSLLGISASTFFPGIEGIVRRIRYENEFTEDETWSRDREAAELKKRANAKP